MSTTPPGGDRPVSLVVNGKTVAVTDDPDTPLLDVLRGTLGLRGSRFGCGEGLCGACTVVVDGRAIHACNTPLWSVADRSVGTIEALAGDPPHPLVEAFIDHQAGQCGYCLPGIVMAAHALLESGEPVDRKAIVTALARNLCRCGAHARILDAIEHAAARMGRAAA